MSQGKQHNTHPSSLGRVDGAQRQTGGEGWARIRWPAPFASPAPVVVSQVMTAERSIFDDADDAADEAATLEGEADLAAGRVISHEAMKAWLLSWGTADELGLR